MYTPAAAEILTIGDELCRGEIVDTNAAWLAERLTEVGLHVRWKSSTTDDEGDMETAFRQAGTRADVAVCSGGLGPTDDDRTVDVVARLLGVEPRVDESHRVRMVERFNQRGFEVTPNNLRQVRVPRGADVLRNSAGLAPGFAVAFGRATLFCTPGVPREMKAIWEEEIAPRLSEYRRGVRTAKRVWRVAGMGESHVDHKLRGLTDGLEGATLHFRIAYPENLVTVVVRRKDAAEARAEIERLDGEVRARLGGAVYGIDDQTLPQVIGGKLRARGELLAVAESCTGGLIGDLITDVPGSSEWFRGGVVAYSNALKQSLLGVREETLAKHGAVSEECVREMAQGARSRADAAWAIAVSGIAGPSGGTPEKPVGLVHYAVAGPSGTEARRLSWPTERRLVKQLAAFAALNLLDKQLSPERAGAPDTLVERKAQ
jgi:nicotinamide-nucleotide amidase